MGYKLPLLILAILLAIPFVSCQQEPSNLPPPAEPRLFEGGGFSFLYPSNWQTMTEADIDRLWETELFGEVAGFSRESVIWIGGVYWGHIDPSNYPDSANIVVVVAEMSDIPGPMSQEDYDDAFNRVKASFESGLGERLYSIQKRMVGELQAIEVEGLGRSRNQVLRSVFIFAKQDYMYYMGCGVSKDVREFFTSAFNEAITSLEVSTE
jgi:hypothetical protein